MSPSYFILTFQIPERESVNFLNINLNHYKKQYCTVPDLTCCSRFQISHHHCCGIQCPPCPKFYFCIFLWVIYLFLAVDPFRYPSSINWKDCWKRSISIFWYQFSSIDLASTFSIKVKWIPQCSFRLPRCHEFFQAIWYPIFLGGRI